ncbi:MAG: DUF489 family protein [Pseudomonadales bacterium]
MSDATPANDPVAHWPEPLRRTMALVGVIAAAARVSEVAENPGSGMNSVGLDEALYRAAADRSPADWNALFPQPQLYTPATALAISLLSGSRDHRATLLYTMQLIALAERLEQQPAIRNALGDLLDADPAPSASALASIYQSTISNLGQRIQVTGDPSTLQQQATAEQIRALLLAGVRFSWLWRSRGGRRRHLVLGRRKLLKSLEAIGARI